jgi:NTE family protein
MGSICGALAATGAPAAEIRAGLVGRFTSRAAFARQLAGKLASGGIGALWSVRRPGVIDTVTLLEMLLPDVLHCDFAGLRVPFAAVAADYHADAEVVLERGPLIPALAASCALPAWARPVVIDGRVLVDGGYVNPVPFDVVAGKADVTIAVDVTAGAPQRVESEGPAVPRRRKAMAGSVQMLFRSVTREKLKAAPPDILIRPAVGRFSSLDFFRIGEILAAAEASKDELKRKLAQRLEGVC